MQSNLVKEGSLLKNFLRYAAPSVAAQWVFALYTMVDGIFVARGVSESALAAVNLSMPFVQLLFAVALLFAVGSSTITAIALGRKDLDAANRAYTQNLVVVASAGVLITAGVLLNLESIALFLGATAQTLADVKTYVGTIAAFSVCFTVGYSFEIMVKIDGKPRLATIFVVASCLLNCALDALFIFGFKWGVFGAALGTGLSQLALVVMYLCYFFGGHSALKLVRFRFSFRLLRRALTLGLPSAITELSAGVVIFFFNFAILRTIGEEGLVSYSIAAYMSTLVVMSATGVAQGLQPLASYCHGRGDDASCKKLLRYGLLCGGALSLLFFLVAELFAPGVVAMFISKELPELRAAANQALRIFGVSFLLLGINVVAAGYFAAVERRLAAMAVSLSRGMVLPPLCLLLLTALFGGAGVWWAAGLSEMLCLALTVVLLWGARRKKAAPAGGAASDNSNVHMADAGTP